MAAYTSSLSESLTNYDSLSTVMPNWLASTAETLTTSDTMGHQFTAVRPLTDTTGASTLGIVNLPLVFTYLPPGSGTDLGARQVQQSRQTIETVTASDSMNDQQSLIFSLSETLLTSDVITLQQTLYRHIADAIPLAGDSVTKRLQASRYTLDQVGNDISMSPMLAFPTPYNDAVTRTSGHIRHTTEVLTLAELARWLSGFSRHYTETLTTSSTVVRKLNPVHRASSETLSINDSVARHLTYQRIVAEHLATADGLLRHLTLHRLASDVLTTNAALISLHSAPRATTDTVITLDQITAERLLQSIMGYIWQAQDGSVIADLPDWGFVLVEDPMAGNIMNIVPVPVTVLDPSRTK